MIKWLIFINIKFIDNLCDVLINSFSLFFFYNLNVEFIFLNLKIIFKK